ncbi:MAG: sulfoxide reductase heme-binding subunit YedZ, partial [Anaerolineae bacterium]|nr:sulfoxide reductase heme-binding subunit YedZ [Anaerolineae bacterium]
LDLILEATFEKRFALVGFAAFMVLLPLAITSTQGWQRRLRKNWKRLHRGVYLAGILAITHFVMLVKADVREPLAYGAVLAVLLLLRFGWVKKQIRNLRGLFSGRRKKQEEVTVS